MDQNNINSSENERGLSTTETRLRLILDETLSPILGEVLTASIACQNMAADFNEATKQTKITEKFYQEQLNELTRKVDDIQTMLMTHISHCQLSQPQVPSTLEPALMNGVNVAAMSSIVEDIVKVKPSQSQNNHSGKDHQKKRANRFSLKNQQTISTIQQSTNKFILTAKNVPTSYSASVFRRIVFSHSRVWPSFCFLHDSKPGEGILGFPNSDQMETVIKVCDGVKLGKKGGQKISLSIRN